MSLEQNLKLAEAMEAAVDAHALDRFGEYLSEDFVAHLPNQEPLRGREASVARFRMMTQALPDLRVENVSLFGQGDLVCHEAVMTGTHRGPLAGPGGREIPATGKRVRFRMCGVLRFEKGKVVEVREYADQLGMLMQLGVLPVPARA